MKAIITHYKLKENGIDTEYEGHKPVSTTTEVEFPLQFGFGSYNEDQIVKNSPKKIFVKNIISIDFKEVHEPEWFEGHYNDNDDWVEGYFK